MCHKILMGIVKAEMVKKNLETFWSMGYHNIRDLYVHFFTVCELSLALHDSQGRREEEVCLG